MHFTTATIALALATAAIAIPHDGHADGEMYYTTEVVSQYITYCPEPTQVTYGTNTYSVTEPTTLTISDCPCTVSKPVYTSAVTDCVDCPPAVPVTAETPAPVAGDDSVEDGEEDSVPGSDDGAGEDSGEGADEVAGETADEESIPGSDDADVVVGEDGDEDVDEVVGEDGDELSGEDAGEDGEELSGETGDEDGGEGVDELAGEDVAEPTDTAVIVPVGTGAPSAAGSDVVAVPTGADNGTSPPITEFTGGAANSKFLSLSMGAGAGLIGFAAVLL